MLLLIVAASISLGEVNEGLESLSGKLYVSRENEFLILDFPLQQTTTALAIVSNRWQ
jgi:hypothetical protein